MTQELNVNLLSLLDPFTRRRFSDRTVGFISAAIPALIQRQPVGELDMAQIEEQAFQIAARLTARCAREKLI